MTFQFIALPVALLRSCCLRTRKRRFAQAPSMESPNLPRNKWRLPSGGRWYFQPWPCATRMFMAGQSLLNPYTGIRPFFSTRIRNGNGINIFEDGKESRDFVYDVVAATRAAIDFESNSSEVFNVGSGVATDV